MSNKHHISSAGLLAYREKNGKIEVLLVHPGGPYWKNKDKGTWSIPKGLLEPEEEKKAAAVREFTEETGFAPKGDFIELGSVIQKSGKVVYAWAFQGDFDVTQMRSNEIPIEWPPKSGQQIIIPEVDRACYFPIALAKEQTNPAQAEFVSRLEKQLQ